MYILYNIFKFTIVLNSLQITLIFKILYKPCNPQFNLRLVYAEEESEVFKQALARYAPLTKEERMQAKAQEINNQLSSQRVLAQQCEWNILNGKDFYNS